MNSAIIQGSYTMLKFVPTRSVVQIIVEAPIEYAQDIIEKLGTPNPATECPVVVARMVEENQENLNDIAFPVAKE